MNKKKITLKKIISWIFFPFLTLNVLIGLMYEVLSVTDKFDLHKLLGGAELYIIYILLVVSLMYLSEVYLKVRSGNVSEKRRKVIITAAVILSIAGLIMEYPALYGEDWSFLFGPACMFIVFLSCMAICPLWFRGRSEQMKTVLKIMCALAFMCIVDVVIFCLVMSS